MGKPRISALVITQNEAGQIGECLRSLSWVDELIVVDGGSEDDTVEIARRFTPHVYVHPWRGYAEQRRVALSKATGEWVLAVDSDERITPALAKEILHTVEKGGFGQDGFYIARKSYFLGKWIRYAGWYPGYQLRLCRRERTRVTDRAVHEGLVVDGPVGYLKEPMLHFTQPSLATAIERANRYSLLEAQDRRELTGVRPITFLTHPFATFLRKYVGLRGFLEGTHGLMLAAVSALYNMLLYMKLWEASHKTGVPEQQETLMDKPAGAERPPVSVLVIARDEETNIEECLRSARWADEVVVVDTGSRDRTVELARRLADRVLERPWEGYATTKQRALAELKHDWVLWLDADERVTVRLALEVQAALRSETFAAYEIPRRAWFLGRWIRHSGWYPGYVVRLFRRNRARFTDSLVHEGLQVSGAIGRLSGEILHITDPDVDHYMKKFNRYTSLAARQEALGGRRFSMWKLLTHPVHMFCKMYLLRLGFLDGVQGWMLALLSSAYVFFKYAKLWELEKVQTERGLARPGANARLSSPRVPVETSV